MPSERELQVLLDKQALHELLVRYCRAVDRGDRELLLSCYHPDAIDDHGLYCGDAEGLADYIGLPRDGHGPRARRSAPPEDGPAATQHVITNESFVIDGDVAYGESYQSRRNGASPANYLRYLDRYERRNGEWRIQRRKLIFDWAPSSGRFKPYVEIYDGRSDPSYALFAGDFPELRATSE